MTKKAKLETNVVPQIIPAQRKLTKKERDELEQQFNESMLAVVDSIESGHIQAPWWRQID